MNSDDLLIENENNNAAMCLITDNHKYHILRHLKYIWKVRVFKHIIDHVYLMYRAKKQGIPHISLDDILMYIKGKTNGR